MRIGAAVGGAKWVRSGQELRTVSPGMRQRSVAEPLGLGWLGTAWPHLGGWERFRKQEGPRAILADCGEIGSSRVVSGVWGAAKIVLVVGAICKNVRRG
jgi:hypothetical protein